MSNPLIKLEPCLTLESRAARGSPFHYSRMIAKRQIRNHAEDACLFMMYRRCANRDETRLERPREALFAGNHKLARIFLFG